MIKTTLEIDESKYLEHPLFRACMQVAVGIEQGHSKESQLAYSQRLKDLAYEYVATSNFK